MIPIGQSLINKAQAGDMKMSKLYTPKLGMATMATTKRKFSKDQDIRRTRRIIQ